MNQKQNVIITGGLGLIGSHLSDILVEKNYNVNIIDNQYRGKVEYLQYPDRVNLIKKDIINLTKDDVIENINMVFHVASKVLGIGYSAKNHQDMLFYNDEMTNKFFSYLDHLKNLKHLVVVSSSCVYDDNLKSTPEELGMSGQPEMANLGYGLAKRFLEQKSILWASQRNVKLTIVRPFNIYGERYTWAGEFSQGLPSIVKKTLDNQGEIEIWGTGAQRRNYIHALDCAKIMIDLANTEHKSEVFNIGIEKTISLKELAELICKLYNIKPQFSFRHDMPEGRLVKSAEVAKLEKYLPNFDKNLISLEDGLLKMREWYGKTFKK
ncbi:MAG: NAD(P)-dependent oxidoreductase [Pseudomonadota bacterium]